MLLRAGNGRSQKYAITVTLRPQQYSNPAEEQYDMTYHVLPPFLSQFGIQSTIVAELTKQFNIHYHGIVTCQVQPSIPSLEKWITDKFRKHKIFGYVYVKVIDNEPVWEDYIIKDYESTKKLLYGRSPVIVDDFMLFNPVLPEKQLPKPVIPVKHHLTYKEAVEEKERNEAYEQSFYTANCRPLPPN